MLLRARILRCLNAANTQMHCVAKRGRRLSARQQAAARGSGLLDGVNGGAASLRTSACATTPPSTNCRTRLVFFVVVNNATHVRSIYQIVEEVHKSTNDTCMFLVLVLISKLGVGSGKISVTFLGTSFGVVCWDQIRCPNRELGSRHSVNVMVFYRARTTVTLLGTKSGHCFGNQIWARKSEPQMVVVFRQETVPVLWTKNCSPVIIFVIHVAQM